MNKTILSVAALLGLLAIVLGAFGAHGLKKVLDAEAVSTFETGVKYQIYHALLLLFVGSTNYLANSTKTVLLYLIVVGIVFFSGSIYGLATNSLTGFDFKKIAIITPIGGALLILSWGILFYNFLTLKVE